MNKIGIAKYIKIKIISQRIIPTKNHKYSICLFSLKNLNFFLVNGDKIFLLFLNSFSFSQYVPLFIKKIKKLTTEINNIAYKVPLAKVGKLTSERCFSIESAITLAYLSDNLSKEVFSHKASCKPTLAIISSSE